MPPGMLDRPPSPPPDVAAQQNAPAFAGVGQKMAAEAQQGGPGAVNAAWSATEKVLQNIARMSPQMQPFVARAMAIMKAGIEQLGGGQPAAPQAPPESAKGPEPGPGGFPG